MAEEGCDGDGLLCSYLLSFEEAFGLLLVEVDSAPEGGGEDEL